MWNSFNVQPCSALQRYVYHIKCMYFFFVSSDLTIFSFCDKLIHLCLNFYFLQYHRKFIHNTVQYIFLFPFQLLILLSLSFPVVHYILVLTMTNHQHVPIFLMANTPSWSCNRLVSQCGNLLAVWVGIPFIWSLDW